MKDSVGRAEGGFIKGAISLSLAALLVKVLGVAYKIPLSHLLDDDGMGFFNTAYTVYTFFFLICSAGVPKAIALLISEGNAGKGNSESSILKNAKRIFLIISLILSAVFAASALPISDFIGSKKSALAMLAIAPSIPFISLAAVYRGYLTGKKRFGTVAVSQLIEAAMKLALGLAFAQLALRLDASKEWIAAAAIFGISVGSIATLAHLKIATYDRKTREISRQKCKFEPLIMRKILKISVPITLSSGVISLVNVIDLTVIMRGLEKQGYTDDLSTMLYGNYTTLAVPMFNFVLSVISSVCISSLPLLSELAARKREADFDKTLSDAAELVAFLALPSTLVFMTLPNEVLTILFDRGSVALGSTLLSLLAPSVALIAFLTVMNTALEARGGYMTPLVSMSIGGAVKLLSSSLLVGQTELAIWGAPLGTAISYIASIFVSVVLYRKSGMRVIKLLRGFILSAICSIVASVPAIALRSACFVGVDAPLQSLLLLMIYALTYLLLSFFCGTLPIKRLKYMAK